MMLPFGILNRFRYNSPVNTITSSYNSIIGFDDTNQNNSFKYGKFFDVVSLTNGSPNSNCSTSLFSPYSIFPHNGYKRMNTWKSIVLDYSEFVDLENDTEVTITFFSHSNIASPAHQNAYAYYGIECLGGGIPQNFIFDVPNLSASCGSPGIESCVSFQIPIPAVVDVVSDLLSSTKNFANIIIDKIDGSGNIIDAAYPYSYSIVLENGAYIPKIQICLTEDDVPFQDFRITYRTLHGDYTDEFRVFVSFYNILDECTTGDQVDTSFHPGIINGDILLCGVDNLPTLHLTPTCITQPVTYQWYKKVVSDFQPIIGATDETLQLAYTPSSIPYFWPLNLTSNYSPFECNIYKRVANYREPYCDKPKSKQSAEFHVYNSETLKLNFLSLNDDDICFGETYTLNIINPTLNVNPYYCSIPSHFNLDTIENQLTFQLYDTTSNQPIGSIFTYNFSGPIPETVPNFSLNFDNINPLTGNTPLFIPTSTGTNQFPITIQISGTYLNCPINPLTHSVSAGNIGFTLSAVGGVIAYNCDNNSIINSNDGITFGGYGWEYSNDGINYNSIPSAPITSNLPNSYITGLTGNPIYIRRVSFGNASTECTTPDYSNIIILTNHPSTIQFNLPLSVCNGSSNFTLPTTSANGILGSWNVLAVNTTASNSYIFTPLSGYCLPNYTYNLVVTNSVVPTFNSIAPICQGTSFTLPTTSLNGISGTWTPAINTSETTTYTFNPTSGGCSSELVTLTVVVHPLQTVSFEILILMFLFVVVQPLLYFLVLMIMVLLEHGFLL